MPDQGLGVWHIIQHYAVYTKLGPPPFTDPARWADGTPSGFAVKNISPAGQMMSMVIQAPW